MGSVHVDQIPVLISGGGLSGLTAALALGRQGVPTIVVERRSKISQHPRADGFTPTTVEIYRSLGLNADVLPEKPSDFQLRRMRVETLTGSWFNELDFTRGKPAGPQTTPVREFSPYRGSIVSQDALEPIVAGRTIELGVDIRYGHELLDLEQTDVGVVCTVRSQDGMTYCIRSSYVIASDGHRSLIRNALGIELTGFGHVNSVTSVLFRCAALHEYLDKGFTQFNIDQPNLKALLLAYGDRRLVLHLPHQEDTSQQNIRRLTYQAIGLDLNKDDIDILGTSQWDMSAQIADKFQVGKVFLIGDAAHCLPPNRGGYGVNTGIADAYNLAWKLAAVYHGQASPKLLDTYEAERLPVAWLRHDQIFARSDFKALKQAPVVKAGHQVAALDENAIEFGQAYKSLAMLAGEESLVDVDAKLPEEWNARPGTRLPHVWLQSGCQRRSTVEYLDGVHWLVLSGPGKGYELTKRLSSSHHIKVKFVDLATIGVSSHSPLWSRPDGCLLVRPDGYIAFRSTDLSASACEEFSAVLSRMLST